MAFLLSLLAGEAPMKVSCWTMAMWLENSYTLTVLGGIKHGPSTNLPIPSDDFKVRKCFTLLVHRVVQ